MIVKELKKWTAQPHYPYTLLIGKNVETGVNLVGNIAPIEINLPESIYTALERNGIIEDVKKDTNSMKAEWVKDRWWLYETHLTISEEDYQYDNIDISFECVDYRCIIYINGKEVYRHIGASIPFDVNIKDYLKVGDNLIRVICYNDEVEMGQIGYTYLVDTQRPRFDYKWDFCPRLVNIGIYRQVYLKMYNNIKNVGCVFSTIDIEKPTALIKLVYDVKTAGSYIVKYTLLDKENVCVSKQSTYKFSEGINTLEEVVEYADAKIWNINNMGEHQTYNIQVDVIFNEIVVSSINKVVGFRKVELVKNEGSPEGSYPYTFVVNGKRTFIRGFNITPLDHLLGNETKERYDHLIELVVKAGANIIRVWGGGVIECDYFYELCSKNGLLVWQDIIQSSSGISNVPPIDDKYLGILSDTVEYTVLSKGSYPSTAVICGGNELFGEDNRPITYENKNIDTIVKIVRKYSQSLFVIPSTSTGPTQEADLVDSNNNHDVHGPWLYMGHTITYDHFNKLKCLFTGEFGCNGMSEYTALKKFLSKDNLKITTVLENDAWRHHGEVWDHYWWIQESFGKTIKNFKDYIEVSRYYQKVGLEYSINSLRRDYPHQSGCMIWQLNEMYPNISSTALIDYYGNKKLGYYAAKRAYSNAVVSFKYDKIVFDREEEIKLDVFVNGDGELKGKIKLEININNNVQVKEYDYFTNGETVSVDSLSIKCPDSGYVIVKAIGNNGDDTFNNEVLFAVKNNEGLVDLKVISQMKKLNRLIEK